MRFTIYALLAGLMFLAGSLRTFGQERTGQVTAAAAVATNADPSGNILYQHMPNDALFGGGVLSLRSITGHPTNNSIAFDVQPQFSGYATTMVRVQTFGGTNGFSVDSNGVAGGNGGGLTNVNAANLTGGPLPVSTLPTVVVTNHDTRATYIASELHVSNNIYGGAVLNGSQTGTENGYDTYQGNWRLFLGNQANAAGFEVAASGNPLFYSWMDLPGSSSVGTWRSSIYLGVKNTPNNLVPANFAGSIFANYDSSQFIPGSGPALMGGPVSAFGTWGGNGSQLAGMPPSPQETVPAMPIPPIILAIDTADGTQTSTNENSVTNTLAMFRSIGIQSALTNAGVPLWVFLQDANEYFAPYRDANGDLYINTTNYPDSTNFSSVVHGYGAKFMVQQYWHNWVTNEFNEWGANPGGGNGYPNIPVVTFNSYLGDCTRMIDMGVDGINFADDTSNFGTGYEYARDRSVIEACLNPIQESGPKLMVPYSVSTVLGGKGLTNPTAIGFFTKRISFTTPESFLGNLLWHDAYDTWPGIITSYPDQMVFYMNSWRAQLRYEIPYISSGHFTVGGGYNAPNGVDFNANQAKALFTISALGMSAPQVGFHTTNTAASFTRLFTNYLQCVTNQTFLKVYGDSLCNKPFTLMDNGATNVSAFGRVLSGGAFSVGVFNEAPISSNVVFSLAKLGCLPNTYYTIYDGWSNTLSSPIVGTNLYTFQSLQSYQGELLYVVPVNPPLNIYYPISSLYQNQNGAAAPWTSLPGAAGKGYQINSGSGFTQAIFIENGDRLAPYTNFSVTAQLYVTNNTTLTNMSWSVTWVNKHGEYVFPSFNASPTVTNGYNTVQNVFSVSPTNSGQLAQIYFSLGSGSQAQTTNVWILGYNLTAY